MASFAFHSSLIGPARAIGRRAASNPASAVSETVLPIDFRFFTGIPWLELSRWPTEIINDDPAERRDTGQFAAPIRFYILMGKLISKPWRPRLSPLALTGLPVADCNVYVFRGGESFSIFAKASAASSFDSFGSRRIKREYCHWMENRTVKR